jgi:hypothetical protein
MIHRREFLSTLVALSGSKIVPAFKSSLGLLPEESLTAEVQAKADDLRLPPRRPITLRSSNLNVTLDGTDGLPFQFKMGSQAIWGEDTGTPITAILCRLKPRAYVTVSLKVALVRRTERRVTFKFEAAWNGHPAARFSLSYQVKDASVEVTLEDVVEYPNYELIEVALPNLVTAREGDSDAWMAEGRDGGSFVRVAQAKPYRFEDDDHFGRISTQLPVGMVGIGDAGCLMEVTAFMDGTETSVVEWKGQRRARIGTIQVHRVHGGRCYNMNDGGDAVCGTVDTPNLLVGQKPRCTLDFYRVEDAAVPWFPAMKLLRARMPLSPTAYYDDKLLYLIAGKNKVEAVPHTTFAQSRQLIQDVARLTDYAPQVALISGWVYDGQDTGYPSDDVVNKSVGSYDELMQLMEHGQRLRANVTVNENYDDAYKSSPAFSLDFIACEPNGTIWKSRAWDGEDSYVVGMAKFVAGGWAVRRIEATMARYKLRGAMLIDALSWFTIRNDWDTKHPASGYKNLVDGKWVVLEEFRKRGVHISSEQFRYPMLGKLSLSVNGPEPGKCPFGGEQVPLTAIVYRKAAIFGGSGDGVLRPMESLFWNNRPGHWFEDKTDRRTITDFYYLVALPYSKVHRLEAESYGTKGTQRTLALEGGSEVTMDASAQDYHVRWQHTVISKNEATMCPVDESQVAFYSRKGGQLSYPLPKAWFADKVTARALTVDGRRSFAVKVEEGQIVVEAPAQVPVMVYVAEEAIPKIESFPETKGEM